MGTQLKINEGSNYMAHNLNFNEQLQRYSMFSAGQSAVWHDLGQRTPETVRWDEAIKAALLDYTVVKRPLYMAQGDIGGAVTDAAYSEVPGVFGTFREDTDAFLGTVGAGYSIVQPARAFEFVDTLLGAINGAHYETAGSLGLGERMWCMARVPQGDVLVAGVDPLVNYLLFVTSFDGTLANIAKIVKTRVVCQNTVQAALGEMTSQWSWKHSKNVDGAMAKAKDVVQTVVKDSKALNDVLTRLARKPLTKDTMTTILDRLFPQAVDAADKVSTRRDAVLLKVLELFESNDKNAFPEFRGTAYNLFNAFTEYGDHHANVRITEGRKGLTESRIRSENAMFGKIAERKQGAVAVIDEVMADVAEVIVPTTFDLGNDSDFATWFNNQTKS